MTEKKTNILLFHTSGYKDKCLFSRISSISSSFLTTPTTIQVNISFQKEIPFFKTYLIHFDVEYVGYIVLDKS